MNLLFFGDYTKAGVGFTPSSAPTVTVYSVNRSTGAEASVASGSATTASALTGRYYYRLTGADLQTFDYHARFHTSDSTVDAQDQPALWTRWSEAIASDGSGLTALGDARLAYLDAAVSTRSVYAGADTAGTTTILAALTPFGNLLLPATVSAAVSAASFTLAFGVAVTAANLVGLQVCFTSGPDLPQKGTVVTATQTDSTHVAVTVAASTFTSTPGVGDTAEVG
jgi:hypothetical protein